ncbi:MULTISPECIES: transcription termination/antitermination NusG family protein [unclassified Serratia (in: enterobacteria)]|uniref:transcription termination/antitermination NusG family protein n=1 Tax=unclassified Serratia (in: enterobacteria) TaxID=2647522 RepID=UPI003076174F
MDIEELNGQSWYLAQYISGGKNRERLFDWLCDQHITPWTPLTIRTLHRTDKINCTRKRISPLFPGYFFLKANLATQTVDKIRRHSAFCGFVMNGSQIAPLRSAVVEGLMKLHPNPTLAPEAQDELESASRVWLTTAQYQYLLRMEQDPHPVSRVTLLMKLVFEPCLLGF